MKPGEKRKLLEQALGISLAAETSPVTHLQCVKVDAGQVEKMVSALSGAEPESLPGLIGYTFLNGVGTERFYNILLDLGAGEPVLCLECDAGGVALQDLSRVWPYAAWWQAELAVQGEAGGGQGAQLEGIQWRLA